MSYLPLYPEYGTPMSLIYSLTGEACSMYMRRVAMGPDGPPLIDEVARLRAALEQFPPNTPLEHELLWIVFIAGAESSTEEDRQYFYSLLLKHHRRSGFTNVLYAITFLQQLWQKSAGHDWVERLLDHFSFIV